MRYFKIKKYIVLFIIIIISICFFQNVIGQIIRLNKIADYEISNIQNPLFNNDRNQNQTDIPTWKTGDAWFYEAHIFSDTDEGLFDVSSDDLRLKIREIKDIIYNNQTEHAYKVDISGNISGTFYSSNLSISGDVEGEISGELLLRMADLSLIQYNITSTGIVTVLIFFNFDYEMASDAFFYKIFEYFDFPLKENEQWNISASAYQNSSFYLENFYDNSSEGIVPMDGYAECLNKVNIVVPAGTFESYHIISEANGTIESWYAPVVKNIVKMYMNNSNETQMSRVWMNLTSYSLHNQQVDITSSFFPSEVNVGKPVTISGYINETSTGTPIQNIAVNIEIPYTNMSFITTTDNTGFYTHTFTAPLILDYTNTSYDIGSGGVIISVNSILYHGYKVSTLTVIGIAVDNIHTYPSVQYEILPVNITCNIYSVQNITEKKVYIFGPTGFISLNTSLNYSVKDKYYFNHSYLLLGNYNFYIWTKDFLGNTNKSKLYNFTIIPDTIPPKIENIEVQPYVQNKNYPVNIICKITDNVEVDMVMVNITDPLNYNINISMTKNNDNYFYQNIYSIIGNYSFFIWTNDTKGNSNISSLYTFEIVNQTSVQINLSFLTGWNLITIPVQIDWWASDISGNLTGCTSISRWDAINQTYQTYIVGGPPTFDFVIKPGCGYFVDMTSLDTLSVRGYPITNVNIPLEIGWNLIGWYHSYDTTASMISGYITGCTSVSRWNATMQTYNTYIVGGPPTFDFTITRGMGLFVDVTQGSIWYGDG